MDIGLVILFIAISLIGNMIKESRKQREGRETGQGDGRRPPHSPLMKGYKPPRRNYTPGMPGRYNVPDPAPARSVEDEDFSLEGKRRDIGYTYESQDMPSYRENRSTLEGMSQENVETAPVSYEMADRKEENTFPGDKTAEVDKEKGINIVFDRDTLINGIIMSEVLSPPKCRR